MNYELIERISEKLIKHGEIDISKQIKEIISYGSTGGEITSMVGAYLSSLKVEKFEIYSLIDVEIKQFIDYAKSIGLAIKE